MSLVEFPGGVLDVDDHRRVSIDPLHIPALLAALFMEDPKIVNIVILPCDIDDRVQFMTLNAHDAAV